MIGVGVLSNYDYDAANRPPAGSRAQDRGMSKRTVMHGDSTVENAAVIGSGSLSNYNYNTGHRPRPAARTQDSGISERQTLFHCPTPTRAVFNEQLS